MQTKRRRQYGRINHQLSRTLMPPLNPNAELGMGSARGPRAGWGGPPQPSSFPFSVCAREIIEATKFSAGRRKRPAARRALPWPPGSARLRLRISGSIFLPPPSCLQVHGWFRPPTLDAHRGRELVGARLLRLSQNSFWDHRIYPPTSSKCVRSKNGSLTEFHSRVLRQSPPRVPRLGSRWHRSG